MSRPRRYRLEICANSIESAINAEAGGADRVELCQNLDVGGITPSYGLIKVVKESVSIPVHVLIRPRAGSFIYTADEFAIMLAEVEICRTLGCAGVVVGMLNDAHQVDISRMKALIQAASPMQVTFHRAFDDVLNQAEALEHIIAMGCSRILTAGGPDGTVDQNAENLAELVALAAGRITIMPGGGLKVETLHGVVKICNASEYHTSARHTRRTERDQKIKSAFDCDVEETSKEIVADAAAILRSLERENRSSPLLSLTH